MYCSSVSAFGAVAERILSVVDAVVEVDDCLCGAGGGEVTLLLVLEEVYFSLLSFSLFCRLLLVLSVSYFESGFLRLSLPLLRGAGGGDARRRLEEDSELVCLRVEVLLLLSER